MKIPPEIHWLLVRMGIKDAARCRWRMKRAWPAELRAYCHCVCGYGRMEMQYTTIRNRSLFIGQCLQCGNIYWRPAIGNPAVTRGIADDNQL